MFQHYLNFSTNTFPEIQTLVYLKETSINQLDIGRIVFLELNGKIQSLFIVNFGLIQAMRNNLGDSSRGRVWPLVIPSTNSNHFDKLLMFVLFCCKTLVGSQDVVNNGVSSSKSKPSTAFQTHWALISELTGCLSCIIDLYHQY